MKEIVDFFLDNGMLLSPDIIQDIKDKEMFLKLLYEKIVSKEKPLVVNHDLFTIITSNKRSIDVNWSEFETSLALQQKGRNGEVYRTFLDILSYDISEQKKEILDGILEEVAKEEELEAEEEENENGVIVLHSYSIDSRKREVKDFVDYFKDRYNVLRNILQNRHELRDVISINRIASRKEKDATAVIAMVVDKKYSNNGNLIITLEDFTGRINALIRKDKEVFSIANKLVLDEVIGITGVNGNNIVFVNNIFFPDVPLTKEIKKADEDVYAAFIGDIHVGSKLFLQDAFMGFIKWLNGEDDSIQRDISKKVKYLFVVGDLVDGIGIYPEQDKELAIKDIKKQYEVCADFFAKIRDDIYIIVCGGNHDAIRISEPQPVLSREFASSLYELNNIIMVSNPAIVNIHSSNNFPGFDVLMYHGNSFDYYYTDVDFLRLNDAMNRPELIMETLLQKRHLAPTHTSTLYIPDKQDHLVIRKVPDFFVSGHVHKLSIANYNNVTMVCSSCWQDKTVFQERAGHKVEPGKVALVNLKTRNFKILSFC